MVESSPPFFLPLARLALALVAGELLDALVLGALFGFDLLLVGLPGSGGFDLYGWIS